MKLTRIKPQFVEYIPEQLEDGVLYISEIYGTAAHKCCCGCGEEVVTPLTEADWSLQKDGETVSLWPSIGNWNYACQSHYVIRKNRVNWAPGMSKAQIRHVQTRDKYVKAKYIASRNAQRARTSPHIPWFSKVWAFVKKLWS